MTDDRHRYFPATDLHGRLRAILSRWRALEEARGGAEGAVYGQCANDLEEIMEECGVELGGPAEHPDARKPRREICLAHMEPEPCSTCAAYIAAGL